MMSIYFGTPSNEPGENDRGWVAMSAHTFTIPDEILSKYFQLTDRPAPTPLAYDLMELEGVRYLYGTFPSVYGTMNTFAIQLPDNQVSVKYMGDHDQPMDPKDPASLCIRHHIFAIGDDLALVAVTSSGTVINSVAGCKVALISHTPDPLPVWPTYKEAVMALMKELYPNAKTEIYAAVAKNGGYAEVHTREGQVIISDDRHISIRVSTE